MCFRFSGINLAGRGINFKCFAALVPCSWFDLSEQRMGTIGTANNRERRLWPPAENSSPTTGSRQSARDAAGLALRGQQAAVANYLNGVMISTRTKAALAAAKARGRRLGGARVRKSNGQRVVIGRQPQKMGAAAN